MNQVSELTELGLDGMVFLHYAHKVSIDIIVFWVHLIWGNVPWCLLLVELALIADLFHFGMTGPGLCAHGAFGLQARGVGTFV